MPNFFLRSAALTECCDSLVVSHYAIPSIQSGCESDVGAKDRQPNAQSQRSVRHTERLPRAISDTAKPGRSILL